MVIGLEAKDLKTYTGKNHLEENVCRRLTNNYIVLVNPTQCLGVVLFLHALGGGVQLPINIDGRLYSLHQTSSGQFWEVFDNQKVFLIGLFIAKVSQIHWKII